MALHNLKEVKIGGVPVSVLFHSVPSGEGFIVVDVRGDPRGVYIWGPFLRGFRRGKDAGPKVGKFGLGVGLGVNILA